MEIRASRVRVPGGSLSHTREWRCSFQTVLNNGHCEALQPGLRRLSRLLPSKCWLKTNSVRLTEITVHSSAFFCLAAHAPACETLPVSTGETESARSANASSAQRLPSAVNYSYLGRSLHSPDQSSVWCPTSSSHQTANLSSLTFFEWLVVFRCFLMFLSWGTFSVQQQVSYKWCHIVIL